jgi:hypothetical protein
MTLPGVGKARIERLFHDVAGRHRRQRRHQRGARDRLFAGIFGPGGDQQRATTLHIFGDVVVIEDRQHVAVLVTVEDDQVEIVDFFHEELARREGDQRQFVDRRAVLLLGRPQDGEVHQVDRGVGLEQVAPGALAGMRFAGNQEHAQVLADAIDDGDSAVVGVGEFALDRIDREFDDVAPGARDRHLQRRRLAYIGALYRNKLAVDRDADIDRAAFVAGGDDAIGHVERLADDAEARRVLEADAAVALVLVAGNQGMQWRVEAGSCLGSVVDLAVSDHDRTGDARRRHVAEGAFQRAEQAGFGALVGGVRAARLDDPHVELLEARQPLLKPGDGLRGLVAAIADVLALAAVDHQRHHALQRLTLLVEQHRVEERRGKRKERRDAEQRAALAKPEAGEHNQRDRDQHGGQKRP